MAATTTNMSPEYTDVAFFLRDDTDIRIEQQPTVAGHKVLTIILDNKMRLNIHGKREKVDEFIATLRRFIFNEAIFETKETTTND